MSADTLLARLDQVKSTGPSQWVARCPGHDDRSPSLSIRELDDGRLLLHCFAQCDVESVLAVVGLTFNDLYPAKALSHHKPGERRPFFPAQVFDLVRQETGVVAVIAADMHKRREVSDEDYERLFLAVERLNDIAKGAYGR